MKSKQVDFSRVKHNGGTISVDTSYVQGPGYAYFETAAKRDGKTPRLDSPWQILGQYKTRDIALVKHGEHVAQIKRDGLVVADS